MKKLNKNRMCFSAIIAFLVVFMVGETFAYDWTQIEQVENEFQTGTYSTNLVEEFTSPDEWLPGVETNKDVSVSNDGTVPVYVMIEISQEWIRRENVYDIDGNIVEPEAGEAIDLTFTTSEGASEYASLIQWGENVVLLSSGDIEGVDLGLPTVDTIEEATGKWLLLEETTDGNYVFYYIGVLDVDTETPFLIDGVELNSNIESATLETNTVWIKENDEWMSSTTTVMNSSNDYENSTYTLSVSMSTVQATSQAVSEMFDSDIVSEQAVISYLQSVAITGEDITYSRDDSVEEKLLYIREVDGELCYIPATPEENWFLSYFNMIPGETYTDTMLIENQTSDTFELYMQAIIKDEQSEMAEELLDMILMTVYYDGEIIYEGSASGEGYYGTLFDVIYLGEYPAGETGEITVVLTLDKDIPMEYCDILANTDWQFMVEEIVEATDVQTGDHSDFISYMFLMAIAFMGVCLCIMKIRETYK